MAPFSIGLDVHRRSWFVTVIANGAIVFHGSTFPEARALEGILRKKGLDPKGGRVAYEVGSEGYYPSRALEGSGLEIFPLPASRIPRAPGKTKNDRTDSRRLAQLLETGEIEAGRLRPVAVPSLEQEGAREVVRTREALIRRRRGLIASIKHRLGRLGIDYDSRGYSRRFRGWVLDQEMPQGFRISLEAIFETIDEIDTRIRRLEGAIEECFTEEHRALAALYRTCPAVGPITAAVLVTELGDIRRFTTPEELTSYVGLCPSDFSTGESDRRGPITKEGNARVRAALVEATWRLIAQDSRMRGFYERIKNHRGSKRAAVATSRKILHALWAMTRTGEIWRKAA